MGMSNRAEVEKFMKGYFEEKEWNELMAMNIGEEDITMASMIKEWSAMESNIDDVAIDEIPDGVLQWADMTIDKFNEQARNARLLNVLKSHVIANARECAHQYWKDGSETEILLRELADKCENGTATDEDWDEIIEMTEM